MVRLTKALSGKGGKYVFDDLLDTQIVADKLGLLEDIEEDLGVDLVRLLNIKSVIYIRNALGDIREIDTKDYGLNINLLNKAIILDRNYYFKDYGKTWAFDKETLIRKELAK